MKREPRLPRAVNPPTHVKEVFKLAHKFSSASEYIEDYERQQWAMAWSDLPDEDRIPELRTHAFLDHRGDPVAFRSAILLSFRHAERVLIERVTVEEK